MTLSASGELLRVPPNLWLIAPIPGQSTDLEPKLSQYFKQVKATTSTEALTDISTRELLAKAKQALEEVNQAIKRSEEIDDSYLISAIPFVQNLEKDPTEIDIVSAWNIGVEPQIQEIVSNVGDITKMELSTEVEDLVIASNEYGANIQTNLSRIRLSSD